MNISVTKKEAEFRPVTVSLEFTSEEELEAFYAVFCHTFNTFALDRIGFDHKAIRQEIEQAIGTVPNYAAFHATLGKC